eukprot:CAMPEP_0195026398 /NCGR_PEP_ID=MMETSP0326_2-20130528/50174_1 /TAXON_ID=2866 ORGANISM="Crypthecodinium cohnii, Strain Seligo" /NCGR_SAMPLE_ID=MMETSP0326_2 /ASSEMBLY_ACC=CAM_ASM_000348 /LENGTH=42 /DNA_ID= /DNA_START= /DNA_END= /DNA_ORIENTATION=
MTSGTLALLLTTAASAAMGCYQDRRLLQRAAWGRRQQGPMRR